MTPAERMHALFSGNPNAHYIADFTKLTKKKDLSGKTKLVPKYDKISRAATVADFEAHLAGKMGLLDIPVNGQGLTLRGFIDVDEYEQYTPKRIVELIREHSLPLIASRTKSGGWHLVRHYKTAQNAAQVRVQMKEWADLLGFKKYDIYPGQDALEPGAVGSGVNLPYFGGDAKSTVNYAINRDGERMAVEGWLDRIEQEPDEAIDLITRHWSEGQRHKLGTALVGFLLRSGRSPEDCDALIDYVCKRTGTKNETIDAHRLQRDIAKNRHIPGYPRLCQIMGNDDARALTVAFGIDSDAAKAAEVREPIILLGCSFDELMSPLQEETYLVEGMVPTEAYTLIAGALSSYKTMLMLNLCIWRATGRNLLAPMEMDETGNGGTSGPTVLLCYEDVDRRIFERLKRLAQHGYKLIRSQHGAPQAEKFASDISKNLRRVPLSGKFGKTLITRPKGQVVPNMAFVEELLEGVTSFASEGVLIGLDPLRLALVGSQNDDDGADVAVNVLNYIASALPNSGLVVCSHTTKNGAKEPGTGYADASYSTSGSALYSQHARSNFLLARMAAEDIQKKFDMRVLSPEDVQAQRVARLTHGRLSHGAESTDQYVRMRHGVLLPIEPIQGRTAADDIDYVLPSVAEAVERLHKSETSVTQNSLSKDGQLKGFIGGEKKIREALKTLVEQQFLEYVGGAGRNKDGGLTEKGRARVAQLAKRQADRCHGLPRLVGEGV